MKKNIGEMNTNNNIGETKLGLPTDDVVEVFRTGHMFPTVNGFDTYSRATVGQMYDSFSANYEQFRELHLHNGSHLMVDYLTRYIGTDNKNLRVLDVACGTGSAGEALVELGFQHIDGLDASSNMLEIARGKGIYTNLIHSFIEECGPAVVHDGVYDVLVSVGFIGVDHMYADDLDVIHRITQPGGHLLIVGSDGNWNTFPEYHVTTQAKIDKMAADRKYEVVVNEVAGKYCMDEGIWHNGRVIILRRLE